MAHPQFLATNNAEGQLDANINASSLTLTLKSAEGLEFPTGNNGTATSGGTSTTLNSTGIGATGVAVGDSIENITDGSVAFIVTVNTNDLVTTRLKGGSDNTWENSDEWNVGRCALTLEKRDGNGDVTSFEIVNCKYVDNSADIAYVATGGRGHKGTTPISFDADDYVVLNVEMSAIEGLQLAVAALFTDKAEDDEVVHDTGNEAIAGVKTFADDSARSTTTASPVDNKSFANKFYVDNALGLGLFYGDGSDGALSIPSGTTSVDANVIKQYSSISLSAGATLDWNTDGTLVFLVTGNVTLEGTVDGSGSGGAISGASIGLSEFKSGGNSPFSGAAGGTLNVPGILAATGGGSGGGGYQNGQPSKGTWQFQTDANPERWIQGSLHGGAGVKDFHVMMGILSGAGGAGGMGIGSGTAGQGGKGGGGFLMIIQGDLTLNNCTINLTGNAGTAGNSTSSPCAHSGGGGGGGGTGIFIVKGSTTFTSPTYTVGGGAGGAGDGSSGVGTDGGAGGAGAILVNESPLL